MENTNKTTFIKKYIISALVSALSVYLGSFFIAAILLAAVLSYCFYKTEKMQKITVLLAFLLVYFILSFAVNNNDVSTSKLMMYIISAFNIILPAYTVAVMFDKKVFDLRLCVQGATLANVAIAVCELAKYKFVDKVSIADDYINPALVTVKNDYLKLLSDNTLNVSDEHIKQFTEYFDVLQQYLIVFVPAFLIIASMVAAFFTVKLAVLFINKLNNSPQFERIIVNPFDTLEIPKYIGFLVFLLFLVLLGSEFNAFVGACTNLLSLFLFEYAVCGLAIIFYWLRKRLNLRGFTKIFIYTAAVIIIAILSMAMSFIGGLNILVLLGMFDSNFDFRKIYKRKRR